MRCSVSLLSSRCVLAAGKVPPIDRKIYITSKQSGLTIDQATHHYLGAEIRRAIPLDAPQYCSQV